MHSTFVSSSEAPEGKAHPLDETRLSGRSLIAARTIWLVLVLFVTGLFVASIPLFYSYALHTLCADSSCGQATKLMQGFVSRMHAEDISPAFYALYTSSISTLFTLCYFVVAWIIFWRKSDDLVALFTAFALITFAITFNGLVVALPPFWVTLGAGVKFVGSVSIILFFYIFPDGKFAPRWIYWLLPFSVVYWGISYLFPGSPLDIFTRSYTVNLITFSGLAVSAVFAQIYRYLRVSSVVQRQQTKWVVFGGSLGVGCYVGLNLIFLIFFSGLIYDPLANLIFDTLGNGLLLLVPISISYAIFRSRLWQIDLIIKRTLVYSALTACVIILYVLVVGGLSVLFQTRSTFTISLFATGLVAVLSQPLRDRLQHTVNRLIYGERDDPYAVLSRLGQRLETTLAPEAVLSTCVETVGQALKLPYAAIVLEQEGKATTVASFGKYNVSENYTRLPVLARSETLGELVLASRSPGETFTAGDLRLLNDLAYQVGVAVNALRLTSDLQRMALALQHSRERIVLAREEERRRLRRDLHDDLGPTLAALALAATTIEDLIPTDPAAAGQIAHELQYEIRNTVGNVRRLAYELRPPTLDELGLLAAIHERATQLSNRQPGQGEQSFQVLVKAPETLPALPAAVEVAVYRIIQEALTNVIRHAQARSCLVRIALLEATPTLQIEVIDDGMGLPAERRNGVGLLSMRERAEELGGTCTIEKQQERGTRICARVPLS